ncbi:MAG: DNA helicase RecQ [SAR202 cluster bacterium]|nr:DNA helicase RecQ [SAR202 cluster bacterium]
MPVSAHDILSALKSHFGYDRFLPLQEEIIGHVLAGKDALVLMPTGGGKSLCYQLPALCLDGVTIVVSPLISLMKDQVDALKANGIAAEFVNSTMRAADIAGVQRRAMAGRVKILYVAPERLAIPDFRRFLGAIKISLVAIDEAHCISEWGHDFRPDYRNLKGLRDEFPRVPVTALTASATPRVRDDIIEQLAIGAARTFQSSFNRANLSYEVVPKREPFTTLLTLLEKHRGEPAIVYCFSRKDTDALAADLVARGHNALPYHAGLDAAVRQDNQEKFIRDQVPVVVATIAFGMGIDKPDVRLVVHYDLPKSLEGYYQETGRAGRDGLPAECLLFYSYGDSAKHEYFIDRIEDPAERGNARAKLGQMVRLAESTSCRRAYLLEYFGETYDQDNCKSCDVCLAPAEEFDGTEIAQKVVSAVVRTGERFGAVHVIDVLRGGNTKKIRDFGHDQLSVYGIVKDFSREDLVTIVQQLLRKGILEKSADEFPVLRVSSSGWSFLKNRERMVLVRPRQAPTHSAAPVAEVAFDRGLFERLRSLRKQIAESRGVPPFVIFGDVALQQMSFYVPQSHDSFAMISGVGREKLAQLGDAFLGEIRRYAAEHGLQERPNRSRPERKGRPDSGPSERHMETRALIEQGLSIQEVASRRGRSPATIMEHLETLVRQGVQVRIDHLLPPRDRVTRIVEAFKTTGTPTLTPVRELLGETYTFDEIRTVRLMVTQAQAPAPNNSPV